MLIVEGMDDAYFLDRILALENADPAIVRVVYAKGDSKIGTAAEGIVKSRDYVTGVTTQIALMRDADGNPSQSLSTVQAAFTDLGLHAPAHGQFSICNHESFDRRTGVWVVPSDVQAGMLETVLLQTVQTDTRFLVVQSALQQIEAHRGSALDRRDKRLMRLFLAVGDHDCMGAGRAFNLGAFDADDPLLADIRQFVRDFLN